jgi:ElaB/YqjD/DUF883 family membrane-anchored ribosome-binding protein
MADAVLAREYIEFVSKGLDQVEAEMEKLRDKIENVLAPAKKVQDQLDGMKATFEKVFDAGKKAFIGLTAAITAWTTAGLAGTAQGEYLSLQFKQLSQQIAAVFLPVVQKLGEWLQKITQWLRSLSGSQQDNILRWAAMAAAGLGMLFLFPKIVAGIEAVKVALASFTAEALFAEGVLSAGIIPLIGLIVSGLTALAVGTETGRSVLGVFWDVLVKVGQAIATVYNFVADLVGKFIDLVGAILDVIGVTALWNAAGEVLQSVWEGIKAAFEALKPIVTALFEFMGQALMKIVALTILFFRILQNPTKIFSIGKELAKVESELQAAFDKRQGDRNKESATPNRALDMPGGQFEDIASSFKRLQSAAMKSEGGSVQDKQLKVQEEIRDNAKKDNVMGRQQIGVGGVAAVGV